MRLYNGSENGTIDVSIRARLAQFSFLMESSLYWFLRVNRGDDGRLDYFYNHTDRDRRQQIANESQMQTSNAN